MNGAIFISDPDNIAFIPS